MTRDRGEYLDVEIHLMSENRARLVCPDRQVFQGSTLLGETVRRNLLALEHRRDYDNYGRTLFQSMFPEETGLFHGLYAMRDNARKAQKHLRLRLNIEPAVPAEIQDFHWELMADGGGFEIGRSPETSFSRYMPRPFSVGRAPRRPRLLSVISAPDDLDQGFLAPIDYDATKEHLASCLAELGEDLKVDYLERPVTQERLRDALVDGRHHLLHIHGHGVIRQGVESALVLEDSRRQVAFVKESGLSDIVSGLHELKLVTLVACHGGTRSSSNDRLSGLAGTLVQSNVPAVVAMRRPISMKMGADFTRFFYGHLAKDACVDAAINEARHQLYMRNRAGIDWSSPVLFMRLEDGLLWISRRRQEEDEKTDRARQARRYFEDGLRHLKRGFFSDAVRAFRKSVDVHLASRDIFYYIALAMLAKRRPAALSLSEIKIVEKWLNAAIATGGGVPSIKHSKAHILLALLKHDFYRVKGMKVRHPTIDGLIAHCESHPLSEMDLSELRRYTPIDILLG